MERGLGASNGYAGGGARARLPGARWALALIGAALLIAAALAAPAALVAQDPGETAADAPATVTLILDQGGDFYAVPSGVATTAARFFAGAEVTGAWKYTAGGDWIAYASGAGAEDYPVVAGDVLWIVAPRIQTLAVPLAPGYTAPPLGPITLALRAGGGLYGVPAGAPTTAARLFGGTDVVIVWKYDRAARAWGSAYVPAQGRNDFIVEALDVLWIVSPRAQTVGI